MSAMLQCCRFGQRLLRAPAHPRIARSLSTTERFKDQKPSEAATSLGKRWKDSAHVVIIGGGAVGTGLAYHLAKYGVSDVVLLEKTELTAGSTWHAAGLTTYYHPGINVKNLHYDSLKLFETLEEETGQAVGLHQPGSIRLALIPERVDEFRYQMSRQGWNKAQQWMLTAEEVEEMLPFIAKGKVLAGLLTPGDGHIDPYSLTQALAIGARKYGADIYQNAPVEATTQRHDGGWDVVTPQGTIRATHLVNASGFWGREVGQLAGLDLPLCAIHHQYLVTNPIAEVEALKTEIPVIRDLEGSYYLRQERSGLLFGPYEKAHKMRLCDEWYRNGVTPGPRLIVNPEREQKWRGLYNPAEKGFGKELFEPDLDRIQDHIEMAMELFPVLQEAEITQCISGPITYSPDLMPMMGPYQGLNNYWCMVGFAYGIIHAGGAGSYLAQWIKNGEPPYDLAEVDPNRYGAWTDTDYTLAKVRESYGNNNLLGYPREEREGGRPTRRKTNIYELQKARGAEMGFHAGWEQPSWFAQPGDEAGYKPSYRRTNWFEPVGRECNLIMNKAGIIDLTPFGKIEVSGPDATKFIDHLCANAVPKLGRSTITHMLTPAGRVYSELTVTQLEPNRFLCVTGSGSERHDQRWMEIKKREWGSDVEIINTTDEQGVLSIAGPKSRDILQTLTDTDISDEAFSFLDACRMNVAGVPVHAIRISYTGELGWEFYMDQAHMKTVYEALLQAGQPHGVSDVGIYAVGTLRLEKGFRMWGAEMTKDHNPFEAGLGFFVKMKKEADFIGKEALKKVKEEGLRRKLVFMNVETTDVDPEGNHSIWHDDKVVGMTTSGAYSYTFQTGIAFAYVPIGLSSPGTILNVEMLGEMHAATVQKGPPMLIESARTRAAKAQAKTSTS